jgi:hypothetical protein
VKNRRKKKAMKKWVRLLVFQNYEPPQPCREKIVFDCQSDTK